VVSGIARFSPSSRPTNARGISLDLGPVTVLKSQILLIEEFHHEAAFADKTYRARCSASTL
jgi:hypothetical protein